MALMALAMNLKSPQNYQYGKRVISNKVYLANIHVFNCLNPGNDPFTNTAAQRHPIPNVIVSLCSIVGRPDGSGNFYSKNPEVLPVPHYSSHAYHITFLNVSTDEEADIFRIFYEKLSLTAIQHQYFDYKMSKFIKKFHQFDAPAFKMEVLRSRWNIDDLILLGSNVSLLRLLSFLNDQVPRSLEEKMNRSKNISDFSADMLFYTMYSGWRQTCRHPTKFDKLKSLTLNFNAYDRIFCDAFDYYNLHFDAYWNLWDLYWLRGRFLRDDLVSSFPPDPGSHVLYYASPHISYFLMQQPPLKFTFIFRPFSRPLWIILVCTVSIFLCIFNFYSPVVNGLLGNQLRNAVIPFSTESLNTSTVENDQTNMSKRFESNINLLFGILQTKLTAAYTGMILYGIINPLFPWTPNTFSELNKTTNYRPAIAFVSPVEAVNLQDNFVLNGIPIERWNERTNHSPTDYLMEDDKDKAFYYAPLTYDDKMDLWISGREFLSVTAPFLKQIKKANDKVLPEMRYISVAAGATRMHFLLDAIKRLYTMGSWMRYWYLEQNFYKNVAPIIVARLLSELGIAEEHHYGSSRPLLLQDLVASFVVAGIGIVISGGIFLAESLYFCCKRRGVS
ncbi:unnamed protein product [Orchesella dallaii]|uniref:Uncharacterized protein n=1 Tax=Orchesella dallaii TaxID=48710 RepID=A0ABP1QFE2_9HEXA